MLGVCHGWTRCIQRQSETGSSFHCSTAALAQANHVPRDFGVVASHVPFTVRYSAARYRPCGVRETPLTCPLTVWLMTQMAYSAWLPYLHLPEGRRGA
jgi:hypothetical protein